MELWTHTIDVKNYKTTMTNFCIQQHVLNNSCSTLSTLCLNVRWRMRENAALGRATCGTTPPTCVSVWGHRAALHMFPLRMCSSTPKVPACVEKLLILTAPFSVLASEIITQNAECTKCLPATMLLLLLLTNTVWFTSSICHAHSSLVECSFQAVCSDDNKKSAFMHIHLINYNH